MQSTALTASSRIREARGCMTITRVSVGLQKPPHIGAQVDFAPRPPPRGGHPAPCCRVWNRASRCARGGSRERLVGESDLATSVQALGDEVVELARAARSRVIVGLCGPPGAGKSTLAAA